MLKPWELHFPGFLAGWVIVGLASERHTSPFDFKKSRVETFYSCVLSLDLGSTPQPRLAVSWHPCLCLPGPGTIGVCYHALEQFFLRHL